ncbi:hypothetical protein B0H17DRAFT_1139712 [Mycena rosella]|uniref:Uncharacterized protein n=1 Tax=Mycena rosella TaxID=1033263 RepID=A0AAD7D403_MYCRO|nr:hypothetical protein B0H17DRAFT_1139712 [Mycena rosella]
MTAGEVLPATRAHHTQDDLLAPPEVVDFSEAGGIKTESMDVDGSPGETTDVEDRVDWADDVEEALGESFRGGKAESGRSKPTANKTKVENTRLQKEVKQLKIDLGVARALLSTAKAEQAKATMMIKNVEGDLSTFVERERWMERKAKDQSAEIKELIQLKELDDTRKDLADAQRTLEEPARKRSKPDRVPQDVQPQDAIMHDVQARGDHNSPRNYSSSGETTPRTTQEIVITGNPVGFVAGQSIGFSNRNEAIDCDRERILTNLRNSKHMGVPGRDKTITLESIGFSAPPEYMLDPRDELTNRGFPISQFSWERTYHLYDTGAREGKHYFVYGFRHFELWLQAKFLPPAHRLLIHYLSLEYFMMHDFLAQALSVISRHRDNNRVALAKCESTSLSNLEYDPVVYRGYLQFRERAPRGCSFTDDTFTLRFRNFCGANLYKVLSLERPVDRPKSQCPSHEERVDCVRVDKLLLEVMSTPGLYEKMDDLQTMVCDTFAPGPWPRASVQSITLDGVVNAMADMGVQINRVDDAWAFAHDYIIELLALPQLPAGWTREEASTMLACSECGPAPPGFQDVDEYFPRAPTLPWKNKYDHTVHWDMAHWRHPTTRRMRRPKESVVGAMIAAGANASRTSEPAFNTAKFQEANPWSSYNALKDLPRINCNILFRKRFATHTME